MTDGSAHKATVVVRCYNEIDHIGRLFEGLALQTLGNFDVVVVDSGSTDGTVEFVEQQAATLVHIAKDDFTFGRSLNLGCGKATGELLVFVSAHCHPVGEYWLANLLEDFIDPRVGAVYGQQRGTADSHFSEQQIFRRWYPEVSVRHQESAFLNNANCAVRRALWVEFPYDETLTGLEDVEWAARVMRDGWRINYRADAAVTHVHDESFSQIRHRYQREAITFQKVFPGEHFNLWDRVRLTMRNIVGDWGAARRAGRFATHWWDVVRFRNAQFGGTYRGFHMRRPVSSELKQRFFYPEES